MSAQGMATAAVPAGANPEQWHAVAAAEHEAARAQGRTRWALWPADVDDGVESSVIRGLD